ncbi:MAG: MerR family transcriptional regulator [Longimicrobiales bacterium]
MNGRYRISEIAARTGITVDALRYYERFGVLPRARRTAGGLRQYGEEAVEQVRFIRQAQALGLTLKDVRQLVTDQGRAGRERCQRVRDLLALRLSDIDARLAEMQAFRRTLRRQLSACERALEHGAPVCPVINELGRKGR